MKREALSEILLEVRLEEVVSPLEEIPGMVKLDALQLRNAVLLVFGAEGIVENGCRENGSGANGPGDKLVALASQDGRVESGHKVVRKQGGREHPRPYRVE